jgi:hypothetical protein
LPWSPSSPPSSEGCGSSGASTRPRIDLTGGALGARGYTLRCSPSGGTLAHAGAACNAVKASKPLLASRPGRDHSCPGGTPVEHVGGTSAGARGGRSFLRLHVRPGAAGCPLDRAQRPRAADDRATAGAGAVRYPLGRADCKPPSPLGVFGLGLPEARGTSSRGSVRALFFPVSGMRWRPGAAIFTRTVGKDFKGVSA